jgi:hypothetical protein
LTGFQDLILRLPIIWVCIFVSPSGKVETGIVEKEEGIVYI